MDETDLARIVILALAGLGFYVIARPLDVAERIKNFYGRYPLIRYTSDEQRSTRPGLVRLVGIAIVGLAVVGFVAV